MTCMGGSAMPILSRQHVFNMGWRTSREDTYLGKVAITSREPGPSKPNGKQYPDRQDRVSDDVHHRACLHDQVKRPSPGPNAHLRTQTRPCPEGPLCGRNQQDFLRFPSSQRRPFSPPLSTCLYTALAGRGALSRPIIPDTAAAACPPEAVFLQSRLDHPAGPGPRIHESLLQSYEPHVTSVTSGRPRPEPCLRTRRTSCSLLSAHPACLLSSLTGHPASTPCPSYPGTTSKPAHLAHATAACWLEKIGRIRGWDLQGLPFTVVEGVWPGDRVRLFVAQYCTPEQ
ncbi:hypothetical protein F4780DRAFT_609164 [Xylariomycetidae sp. FL0641]|nr:hypothetical protein F4780DRAFT_609164 [Xylariomycetidae sp. FL0641]